MTEEAVRPDGWDVRLIAEIEAWKARPFAWGGADCIGFALACMAAVRQAPVIEPLPPYDSKEGAMEVLAGLGAATLTEAMAAHLAECPVSLAQRGDAGIVEHEGRETAVIFMGAYAFAMSETGVVRVPREAVKRAFRV